ncbi:MAG: hypothetical protein AAF959_07840 [Cyanobacteria bacterium P01_D01_bin.56]
MANLSEQSPKNLSPRKKALGYLKEILTSPYGVAAIASLSFHGVLFAAVPRFSSASFAAFNDDNAGETRTVPLVTLSPAEQGRLPNFNQPKLPSIPDITATTSPRSLPSLPNSTIFNRSGSRLGSRLSTPPGIGSSSGLNRNRPFRNPYIPRPTFNTRNTPTRSAQSSERRTTAVTDLPPTPPSNANRGVELTDEEILKRQQQLEAEQAANAEASNNEESPGLEELPEQSGEQTSETSEQVAINNDAEQLSRLEQLQARFQYNDEDTQQEAVDENYDTWESETEEAIAAMDIAVETAEKSELTIDSGFGLCVANAPTNGEVGILVAPDGTPSNPKVLRSTGYEHINQAALAALLEEDEYPAADVAVRYIFDLKVDYDADACNTGDEILETAEETPQTENAAPAEEPADS